jgi:hypothetical protein
MIENNRFRTATVGLLEAEMSQSNVPWQFEVQIFADDISERTQFETDIYII